MMEINCDFNDSMFDFGYCVLNKVNHTYMPFSMKARFRPNVVMENVLVSATVFSVMDYNSINPERNKLNLLLDSSIVIKIKRGQIKVQPNAAQRNFRPL